MLNLLTHLFNNIFRPYVNSDVKLCTRYLELLCQHEPNAVMDFVKMNDSLHLTEAMAVRIIIVLYWFFFAYSVFLLCLRQQKLQD